MANISEEWLERAISDGHINYLEYSKFTAPTIIGIGGFGSVFKCDWKECELTDAFKCLKVNTNLDKKIINDFINELKLLRKVCYHPNIITFYGVTKDNNGYYNMVLQYANDGNLREYLKAKFPRLLWVDKLRIAKEIVLGLLFLHNNDVIHRDLHSKNILIHHGQPQIADFGLSKQIKEASMTSSSNIHGMLAYMEPKRGHKRDKKSDIYSLGVILWEISSGRPPYQTFESEYSIAIHIYEGNREIPIEGTPFQYIELYKQCWDKEPSYRPETKFILDTLNQLTPDEILSRNRSIETASQDNEPSITHKNNVNTPVNSKLRHHLHFI